jgi:hypothetical protein
MKGIGSGLFKVYSNLEFSDGDSEKQMNNLTGN